MEVPQDINDVRPGFGVGSVQDAVALAPHLDGGVPSLVLYHPFRVVVGQVPIHMLHKGAEIAARLNSLGAD